MSLWHEDFCSYCVLSRPLVDDHLCCCCLSSRHCWFSHSSDPQSSPGSSASFELTSLRSL